LATDVAANKWSLCLYPWGPDGTVDQPSDFFAKATEELAPPGIETSWSFKYNGGATPIAFPITYQNATHSKILEIPEQAYAFGLDRYRDEGDCCRRLKRQDNTRRASDMLPLRALLREAKHLPGLRAICVGRGTADRSDAASEVREHSR